MVDKVRCPKPGTESAAQRRMGLTGCGSANVTGPDLEGLYDCLNCGLFFILEERKVN